MKPVTTDQLYQVIGAQNVEILLMRNRIVELEARVKALTPAQTPVPQSDPELDV